MKTSINNRLITTAALWAMAAPIGFAEEGSPHEFSANVALTTDYRFRGITQTSEDPAISGGFDYAYTPVGFYAGVWASNLDFNVPDPDPADLEIDFYGGFAGEVSGFAWDVGGLYYAYPGSDTGPGVADYDYFEVYGSLGREFGAASATVGINYSPDYFFESDEATYIYFDLGFGLPGDFSLSGHVGHQWIDDNAQFGTPDYVDWSVGIAKDIGPFTFDLSYVDTDLDDLDCFGGSDFCDGTAIFTISASF